MNTRRFILPLLWFNLRQLPPTAWYLSILLLFQASMFIGVNIWFRNTLGESSSLNLSLNMLPVFFCGIIGMQFMLGAGMMTGSSLLIPAGEFLLARAVPRSTAYFTRIVIIFLAMLTFPLVNFGSALSKPDLRLLLYHSKTQSTAAYDKLAQLQAQFPDCHVIPGVKSATDLLVIPHGQLLIAAWQLWIVFLMAMFIQAAALLAFHFTKPAPIVVAAYLAPLLLLLGLDSYGKNTGIMENAFFLFAHYWVAFVLLAFALFNFLQRVALKRIQDLEVI